MGKIAKKRRSRNKEETPELPKRVKGRGLAYLLALEKGGSKRHLATAQAQINAREAEEEEEEEEEGDQEIKVIKEIKVTNNEPKVAKRIKQGSPMLLEPFKNGWRREVVYRATVDPGTKTLCDVYYYAPDGKKLRSGREVAMHLQKVNSHLSIDNFAFFKDPIGIDSNQELVRSAKKRTTKNDEVMVAHKKKPLAPRKSGRKKKTSFKKDVIQATTYKKDAMQATTYKKDVIQATTNKRNVIQTPTHKNDVIQASEEELIRNLQELGGIIAEALENAKCSARQRETVPSPAGRRRQHRQATGNGMMKALQAQTFQTKALLAQTFQPRSHKFRMS